MEVGSGKGKKSLASASTACFVQSKSQLYLLTAGECWFCLSNPKVTKHLIASIGNECYVTLPKGQVPNTQDGSSPVPGGGHVLIIPVCLLSLDATHKLIEANRSVIILLCEQYRLINLRALSKRSNSTRLHCENATRNTELR